MRANFTLLYHLGLLLLVNCSSRATGGLLNLRRTLLLNSCIVALLILLYVLALPHLFKEFFLLPLQLFLSVLRISPQVIFIDNDLGYSLMTFTLQGIGCYLLLIDLSPLDDLIKPATHIRELEVGACLWACILGIWIIIEIDSLIIHKTTFPAVFLIRIVCHFISVLIDDSCCSIDE